MDDSHHPPTLTTGISCQYDNYRENNNHYNYKNSNGIALNTTNNSTIVTPGIFTELSIHPFTGFGIIAGIRADYTMINTPEN